MSTTHIAGTPVVLEGRWLRQRCSWCGESLIEADEIGIPAFTTWAVDTLVRVHRDGTTAPVDRQILDRPVDACYGALPPTEAPKAGQHPGCDGTCAEPKCTNGMPQTALQVDDQEHEQRVDERQHQ